mgnify:FL=1
MAYLQILIGKKFGMKIHNKAPEGGGFFLTNLRENFLGDLSMSNYADTQRAKDPLIVIVCLNN